MEKQKKTDFQAKEILEKYKSGAITIQEALSAYEEIENLVSAPLNSKIKKHLRESHREEILRDLPETD